MKIINYMLLGLIIAVALLLFFNPSMLGFGRYSTRHMHGFGMAWVWLLVIFGVMFVSFPHPTHDEETIIRCRYAKGEIDDHEYKRIIKTLKKENDHEEY